MAIAYEPNAVFDIDQASLIQSVQAGFSRLGLEVGADVIVAGCIPFNAMDPACLYRIDDARFCQQADILRLLQASEAPGVPYINPIVSRQPLMTASEYKRAVALCVASIQKTELSKVVLAQAQRMTLTHPVNIVGALTHLLTNNSSGYTYSVPVADNGVFIGASPELLVRQQGNQIECFPLAGTAPRHADPKQDQLKAAELLSSMKNQHEHQLVVEDIVRRISPLVTGLTVPASPELVCTSKVWHLGSKITGVLQDDGHVLDLVRSS